MTGLHVKYSVAGAYVGLELGGLRFITEHTGFDHISTMDVRFDHGLLQMTTEALGLLVRQGQEILASLPVAQLPNCSGATADLGDAV